ncbi:FAD-dependent pyridine nucleotide-disulfide oxidoreductase [Penicillium robsamsonii]|uniref:FAD-dependent pyridine nucleotide-disulfide oxidoreductase n=1 Tax=Penicillium robsamsonii TaxID=1792511 RepID=UPI002548D447|nr:FAD-dependent pyridine nucleotide-disulfide oxidoreductase [Penicillium robsamsonii]KAJ5826933.1 FAD-dependent pyridine nucleotide-disulfide oxidoreductase [Penicillium robsamsonii]
MSKKVAIIGAGPSGLVTAKTLLHNFPRGTFSPIIFEGQNKVGGLWSSHCSPNRVNGPPVTLDPRMRTNLSRFTVAFSDLAWESVISDTDVPVFPQATQVGEYLAYYAERYVPAHVLRLGSRVVRTIRRVEDGDVKWNIQWIEESAEETHPGSLDDGVSSEDFDLLVIASGYFAQQYIPNIPGLSQFQGQIIHSSLLHSEREQLPFNKTKDANGQIVVIGGSMSGVEAASAVALHQSSSALSTNRIPHPQETKVHHIHSRPFWALPTYLPHEASDGIPSFLPLDLAMYDLGRRPPGPIEYTLGPVPEERAVKMNSYFHSLLGSDYEKYAHMGSPHHEQSRAQPPWVAIGNDYAEFVRCGAIQPSIGRVTCINSDPNTKQASVQYKGPDGVKTIENVAAIVMATGFTPYKSLSLLPDEVLTTLEYSKTDPFSPLILDKGGTIRSEIPDVGFVGFYRGPYWGVMEMQARFLGKLWSGENKACETNDQKESLRSLRCAHPDLDRGQFPMADYVGLMESFSKDLDITRSALLGDPRSGPVVPARYLYDPTDTEAEKTLGALRDALVPGHVAQKAAASAIFRALHGMWKFSKQTGGREISGTLAFYPRYPTSPMYDREYVCVETFVGSGEQQHTMRLAEAGFDATRIEIWLGVDKSAGRLTQVWELTPLCQEKNETGYVISAKGFDSVEYLYTFHFKGVSILSWECVEGFDMGRTEGSSYSYVRDS